MLSDALSQVEQRRDYLKWSKAEKHAWIDKKQAAKAL